MCYDGALVMPSSYASRYLNAYVKTSKWSNSCYSTVTEEFSNNYLMAGGVSKR